MNWLVNGNLIDVRTGRIEPAHVAIDHGRITEVSKALPAKINGPVTDLAGAYLLPGFIDCHVHICVDTYNPDATYGWAGALPGTIALFAAQAARRMLLAGVTTARDVGGWDYHEIAVREAIRQGWIEGSRLICAGRILSITSSSTAYYRGMYEEADGPDAVREAARKQFAHGAQFIKLLATGAVTSTEYESPMATQYRPAEIRAAVEVARDQLSYVAAHAHSPDGIRNAVEAGCHSIEHTVYGNEEVYRLMATHGTYLVPTLCASQAMFSDPNFSGKVTQHIRERYRAIKETHAENIRTARRLGVKIAMGSDAGTPGNHCGDNMQELETMVKDAGFSTLAAIQAATVDAAAMMRIDDRLGDIAPGKIADLIALKANPLDDIGALRRVEFVMKDGRIAKNLLHALPQNEPS
jgi:imidazolonepropionase-like amidohydrolase